MAVDLEPLLGKKTSSESVSPENNSSNMRDAQINDPETETEADAKRREFLEKRKDWLKTPTQYDAVDGLPVSWRFRNGDDYSF